MKNGIVTQDEELFFYKDGVPFHAGVVEIDGEFYYAGRNGKVATGQHVVHKEMSNGLLERGTYTFDEDGKLIKDSFIPAKRIKSSSHSGSKKSKKSSHSRKHRRSKFKLTKKKKLQIAGIVLAVVLLFTMAFVIDRIAYRYKGTPSVEPQNNIVMPDFKEPVALCTAPGLKLYINEITMESLKGVNVYIPFKFNYKLPDTDGVLYLSEKADMSDAKQFILSKFNVTLEIDNLKTATTYYYKVQAGEEEFFGSFETAESTRFIYIPGVYNTRDIGGYTTADGKTVKQGMIIRGTEMDGLVEASYFLSNKNVDMVQEQFGFAFEMDLRNPSEVANRQTSHLGNDVRYKCYGAPMYLNVFNSMHKTVMKSVFSDLAKEENYPMYLHCTYGADRTGTIVYLLQGLLGMTEEDMVREYQMSGMFIRDYGESTRMDSMAERLEQYSGDTVAQRIENFLVKEIGVTKAEIQSIRNILLED